MNVHKLFWGLRGVLYKARFGNFGNWSYIGKPLMLTRTKRIKIGNRVRIYPGARIEVVNSNGSIIIEENTSIGQNIHITAADEELIIGKNTTISANTFITNIDHNYTEIDVHILKQPLIVKKTCIGENCFIGYGAKIQAGTILGKQCIVGAGAVVRGVFPDYCVIVGVPGKIVKRYNPETNVWEKV